MTRTLDEMDEEEIDFQITQRQGLQRRETADFLESRLVEGYPARRADHWNRDYASVDAYRDSVAPNRDRWRDVLGTFDTTDGFDPSYTRVDDDEPLDRLSIRLFDDAELRGRGLLALPDGEGPHPLIVCQHGYTSSPEMIFGYADERDLYRSYGRRLVEAGYAVLAPLNITHGAPRNRNERLCQLLGKSLFGLEVARTGAFLDFLETRPEVDAERVGMWGLSMGGTYTLFTLPAETRIRVGICSAFFNDRRRKMVLEDPRFSEYISEEGYEHMFLPGWLREFSDADLVSLICPRPFMIQGGVADGIAWTPHVEAEFERARHHYEALAIGDRVDLCQHPGGHEVAVDEGIDFLERHL